MISIEARQVLKDLQFIEKDNSGWFSYWAPKALRPIMRGFGTNRIAKLMCEEGIFAITIGETTRGKQLNLSDAIDRIFEIDNITQVPVPSTSGTRKPKAVYQGFNLHLCDSEQLRRLLLRLEGVLIGATTFANHRGS